jgi:hypothetical protein
MGNIFTDIFSTKPAEEAAKAKALASLPEIMPHKVRSIPDSARPRRSMGKPTVISARLAASSGPVRTPITTLQALMVRRA